MSEISIEEIHLNLLSSKENKVQMPYGICVDDTSTYLYISDTNASSILKVDIRSGLDYGNLSKVTDSATQFIDKIKETAKDKLSYPRCITTDNMGSLYVADSSNNCIRKILIHQNIVSTIPVSFHCPFSCKIYQPTNSLYIVDTDAQKIRKVSLSDFSVTDVAGSGKKGCSNGAGHVASFAYPRDIAFDRSGNLFITDTENFVIRKIDAETNEVSIFAGCKGALEFTDGSS